MARTNAGVMDENIAVLLITIQIRLKNKRVNSAVYISTALL